MFDDFLRERSRSTGEPFTPFDPVRDYDDYIDGKPRFDGTRSFLAARGIELPDGRADDPPGTQTVHGLGNRKNQILLAKIRSDGVEAYEGSVRYVRAVRDAGLRRAVVSSSANCRDVLAAAHIEDLFEVRIDGIVAERDHLRGKPAPDTFLAGARALGLEPAEAAVFEDALAGVEAGRAGKFGFVSRRRSRGAGGCAESARRGYRRAGSERIARTAMIKQPEFSEEPWSLREIGLDLDRLAQTESLFALSNGHLGWRGDLDEGEPHGLPGSYLNGVYEVRPLPASEAAYGRPESGRDHHQRHERQADQAVRGRRAVRRPLRPAALARAAAGLPGGHADQARGVGVAGRRGGPDQLDPAGVFHPPGDSRGVLRGRARRRAAADHGAVGAAGERAAAVGRRRPARRVHAGPSAGRASSTTRATTPSCWCTRPRSADCG